MILYFDIDYMNLCLTFFLFFFFNDTATTEIYTLSLHDALPISRGQLDPPWSSFSDRERTTITCDRDRKSTRLNSSHPSISYAVFCLKKKKKNVKVGGFPNQFTFNHSCNTLLLANSSTSV